MIISIQILSDILVEKTGIQKLQLNSTGLGDEVGFFFKFQNCNQIFLVRC